MTRISWDAVGDRRYETGVDHGVLYIPTNGVYGFGVPWNGLTAISESPSGAEASPQYADNIKYLNLVSAEEFGGTIEAFTYPDEFEQCDGTASLATGVTVGQQTRKTFGLSYRTLVGNDVEATDLGYKLHLVYGALAAPSEKSRATVNESPEAVGFSWEFSTTPVDVPGAKPSATLTIDSTKVSSGLITALEAILYGAPGVDPRLPLPAEVAALFAGGALVSVMPTQPTYDSPSDTITIPATVGVVYKVDGVVVPAGALVITTDTIVTAEPATGYVFPEVSDRDWFYDFVA